jgi:hypothetical protein
VLLDGHQAGLLAEEDLVGGRWHEPGAAQLVEDRKQGGGPLRRGPPEAAQRRDTGGAFLQGDNQQASCDREADAFGLGRGGKVGLPVRVEDNGASELVFEVGNTGLELFDLLAEGQVLLLGWGPLDGPEDLGGVAVEGLS